MFLNQFTNLPHRQKIRIGSTIVGITRQNGLTAISLAIAFYRMLPRRGQDGEVVAEVHGVEAVAGGDHFLMDFFARADADDGVFTLRANGLRHVGNVIARDFRYKNLATFGIFQCP